MLPEGTPLPGETFAGKYRIDRILGEGGMGVVVAAHHLQLEEHVAIKFLRPEVAANAAASERFMREARASAKVKSEHIARVFDVGNQDGVLYMVMEHLEGKTLAALLEESGPLSPELVVEYVLQACDAIAEAHGRGIVHRDLKPENLFLIRRANGSACVKVLDFGISKVEEAPDTQRMTSTSALMGSPMYMSPEQLATPRDVDPRTDVWSLGVVMYELLTGSYPFDAETLPQLCIKIREERPVPPRQLRSTVLPDLENVVMRCLEKDPSQRYATVADLCDALAPLVPEVSRSSARNVPMRPSSPDEVSGVARAPLAGVHAAGTQNSWNGDSHSTTRSGRRSVTIAAVGTLVVVVGVAIGFVTLSKRGESSQPSGLVAPLTFDSATKPAALPPTAEPKAEQSETRTEAAPSTSASAAANSPAPSASSERVRPRNAGSARKPPSSGSSPAPGAPLPPPPDDRK